MTPPPTKKRPFYHPVPPEALEYFVHPDPAHRYAAPAAGREGMLYCSNGWLAVRFFNFPASFGTGPMTVVDRLRKLPWRKPHNPQTMRGELPGLWRATDDCTLDIYRDGLADMWLPNGSFNLEHHARFSSLAVLPLVSLQLIARLPATELCTAVDRDAPVPFRFRGGEGLMAQIPSRLHRPDPEPCIIFPVKHDRI